MFQDELGRVEPSFGSVVACRIQRNKEHPATTGAGTHVPIIKNLTPQYMSSHPPTVLIALLNQPVVPEHLRVEIEDFERRVMHVTLGPLEEKEAVVVDELVATVQMHEGGDVAALGVVQQIAGFEVEVAGPEA